MQQESISSEASQSKETARPPHYHFETILIWLREDDEAKTQWLLLVPKHP